MKCNSENPGNEKIFEKNFITSSTTFPNFNLNTHKTISVVSNNTIIFCNDFKNFLDKCKLHPYPEYLKILFTLIHPAPALFKLQDKLTIAFEPLNSENIQNHYVQDRLVILNCLNNNKILVEDPGSFNFGELVKVFPVDIQFKTNNNKIKELKNIYTINNPECINLNSFSTIIGTKEQIKKTLDYEFPVYFSEILKNDKHIINLGSQTNLEGLAKNLYSKLSLANLLNGKKLVLNQAWGTSYWAQNITANLQNLPDINQAFLPTKNTESRLPHQEELNNTIDNFIKPAFT
ncbi:MAG: hypothetical protein AAGF07_03860 [Patescibacteria group bacterium]